MKRKSIFLNLAGCTFLVAATFCALPLRAGALQEKAAAPAVVEVTDETGRVVKVPKEVKRIVSLAPSLTETVYALGLQDKLVGDTDYCDYPEDATKKHRVGGAVNPNLEEIVALKPDLVLMTKNLNRPETVYALDRLGIAAYATDPHSVQEIIQSSKKLAEVLGAPEAGETLRADLQRRLDELEQKLSGTTPKRVLFVVWPEPLISTGKKTFLADAMQHAGGESVVDSKQDWPQFSLEEAVRLQPEYLIFASSHSEGVRRDVDALALKPGWKAMDAMKNRKVAVISDAVNRPAPRLIYVIEDLARQLHPEVFTPKTDESAVEKNNR